MTLCKYCNKEDAGEALICKKCTSYFNRDMCVAELTSATNGLVAHSKILTDDQITGIILIRQKLGDIINRYTKKKD